MVWNNLFLLHLLFNFVSDYILLSANIHSMNFILVCVCMLKYINCVSFCFLSCVRFVYFILHMFFVLKFYMFLCDIGCKNHTLSLKALQCNTIQRYEMIQIWVGKIIQKHMFTLKRKRICIEMLLHASQVLRLLWKKGNIKKLC